MFKEGIVRIRVFVLLSIISLLLLGALGIQPAASNPQEFVVKGYIYENDNGDLVPIEDTEIKLVNLDTGESHNVFTDEDGYYFYDMGSLPGGASAGDTIRRNFLDLLDNDKRSFTDCVVRAGVYSDTVKTIVEPTSVVKSKYQMTGTFYLQTSDVNYKAYTKDNGGFKTNSNGVFQFTSSFTFKDDTSGSGSVTGSLKAWRQDGLINNWPNGDEPWWPDDVTLIAQSSTFLSYSGPLSLTNLDNLALSYNPPDSAGSTIYVMSYIEIAPSKTDDYLSVLVYNIPMAVTA